MFKSLLISALFVLSSQVIAATATNIAESAEQVSPLLPGLAVPNIELKDQYGKTVSLAERFKEKTTVLIVYRGGWCPYCSKQLANVQKIEKELADLGAQIIAVSPDSPEKLAESKITSPNYQLLSDDSLLLAQKLGLAFYLDDKTAKIYRNKLGVNFVSLEGEVKVALPVPAVFVIDTNGLVNFQYANPNYKVRLTEDLLLAAVKSVSEQ
ncbi:MULTISPECIES: peroxiredoxin-like family protein [Pseudoalteromonas]|jgi:peroxiredoxin|uniref:thioredoxin-dependent peroxiredoxin n=1 Tax=Pseudoalteromonas lipolytica TaxID=570156 RepID=A0A0P7D8W3_9GAMM|nr:MULTISPECIES: peroxiredoxin-like family protein [Pseudoalteromonas]MED5512362.1 peroxiredoxin-like family protein [Pseudomonadota bacterium]KPM76497.1 alkyl hydroperoxide reductase [Pseudoalteromonas lipolytica]MCF2849760.1 AhpC/TSA family protein [Pseudoalteromonas sp. PAST1]MCH2089664.1 AhpC/TSA family protein [Pseudoalteromonas sp.]MCO7212999.1 AhpC/TSA family protein [Pseudoalteromonas sp. ACER1]|tara:strand:+ start:3318 stop:3947 length:630 start_codon:yes stop_codon:yes gene_type:complete